MSPKRNERAAPPPLGQEWDIRFSDTDSAKGWEELARQVPGSLRECFERLRAEPAPRTPSPRHSRLRHDHAVRNWRGRDLPQWQYEVTGGGRVWYVVDVETRTVWITYASPRHPKVTE
ncbi:hypothetical protein [Planomonospora venezuelensis]|uniref:Cytotoxic translational repressor of toxin-antitoxin stability system n=1 Tax=Planomonospora venezuelensis TaxID=1999 RepID=A0A841DBU6_PLAVE|nr:hypothetical protein [Planomonospora venezuelensis]MBB5964836.1 hypothetical protein [Planomonospora venezuelensis]GIM99323.1 hypothetical protein Pve01_09820 [Planomonospora venezuelensis]